jgi:repressor LexA
MDDLSPRQRDVLDFIQSSIAQRNIPPTYREIGDALGISSTNGVADHVKALIRKGYLKKATRGSHGGVARGLMLTNKSQSRRRGAVLSVPLIGTVAAGAPILAEENYEKTLHLDRSMTAGNQTTFALRVRGDSMIEEGILDGDMVIVRQQNTARNGDIVVAMVDAEATVKFFFRERERIRLQPAHPTMAPIYVNSDNETAIQGVVIGVYRKYA